MTDFRHITPSFWVSPQIEPADIATAARDGVTLVVNNRPDGESPEEPQGNAIEQAAQDAGIAYVAIPITHAGFSEGQVIALGEALAQNDGKTLAYCRSGTRSTLLWALAAARSGEQPDTIATAAANAGYDVSPVAGILQAYASAKAEVAG